MLRILSRTRRALSDLYVSDVWDPVRAGVFQVLETEGAPQETECVHCVHGTRCAHARIVREAAEAVAAARVQSSMGVQS